MKEASAMKRPIALLCALLFAASAAVATAQQPLYLVNGVESTDIDSIPPEEIEHIETLPADEETIARYGEKGANGVMIITLRYDSPAQFSDTTTFDRYIARRVRWDDDEPVAPRRPGRCRRDARSDRQPPQTPCAEGPRGGAGMAPCAEGRQGRRQPGRPAHPAPRRTADAPPGRAHIPVTNKPT